MSLAVDVKMLVMDDWFVGVSVIVLLAVEQLICGVSVLFMNE